MSKMIQVRNVPDGIHERLKVRAAKARMTLSDFLLGELTRIAARPPLEEVLAAIRADEPLGDEGMDPATLVREERAARAAHIESLAGFDVS